MADIEGDEGVFELVERDGIALHTVPSLFEECGIGIAFTERAGGVSEGPYASLNLAAHVGDDPGSVNRNRALLLDAIGIGALADRLTTAEQVHGTHVTEVTAAEAGSGALAGAGRPPIAATDALWTRETGVPLMLLYADCIPVVLVHASVPAVAVVHAGWRGLAAGVVDAAIEALTTAAGEDDLRAFVGPHIRSCCYQVGPDCVSHFDPAFATITEVSPHLDLGAAVAAELERSGVPRGRQWHLGICTAHSTDRFYSYRADGQTGRHGALAVIL